MRSGLNPEKLRADLRKYHVDADISVYDRTESTNDDAKAYIRTGGDVPALFAADEQTGGRGRMGRRFYSPSGTGIYMSLAVPAPFNMEDSLGLTAKVAVAVCRAIRDIVGAECGIKWVNDIYYEGKKVCGILCESVVWQCSRAIIIGIGINVSTENFPQELKEIAGSINGGDVREELIARIAADILAIKPSDTADYMEEYRCRSVVIGKDIVLFTPEGNGVLAKAVGIDDKGGLIVLLPNGERRTLSSGEISVRVKDGEPC